MKARTVTIVLEVETAAPLKKLKDRLTWEAAALIAHEGSTVKQVSVQVADKTKS